MTRDELIDLIENAIDNVHDLDVTHRDYAEAAADAVLAALPELQGWRDIARAPKDGTEILVCCVYDVQGAVDSHTWVDQWWDNSWAEYPKQIQAPIPPTHWMPLPPAPKGDSHE